MFQDVVLKCLAIVLLPRASVEKVEVRALQTNKSIRKRAEWSLILQHPISSERPKSIETNKTNNKCI